MNIIFISELAEESFIEHMKDLGRVILVPKDPRFDPRIASHPDLVITIVDNSLIIDENADPSIFLQLDALHVPYIRSSSALGSKYPKDIAYNAVVTKQYLIHKLDSSNPLILQHCKNSGRILVNVKQGYSKCSTVVVDDNHLISSDNGICQTVSNLPDIDILPVQPGFVELEGFDYGFLGGCSGVIGDTLVFHGDLSKHPDYLRIKDFAEAAGKRLLYFTDFPLRDIGSILVLQTDDRINKSPDPIIYKKHVNIPIFISHEGCPNDCVFCNQRKITAKTQAMTTEEVKEQIKQTEGKLPDIVMACVGGGSNAMGLFYPFINDLDVKLVGVEAAGEGIDTERHAAAIAKGEVGVLHGMKSYFLQDEEGQIKPVHSISAGLDYPGIGPEHAYLYSSGRAKYVSVTDRETVEAFQYLARTEGILPALESSHAIAYVMKLAPTLPKDKIIIVNLSGRGDKDVQSVARYLEVNIDG